MNPQSMLQLMGMINTFRTSHPKFASFIGMFIRDGIPEGSIIEITVTKPGEDPVTTNMKVTASDEELLQSLKGLS
ncbi:MAG: hypothetical protein K6F35_07665 [Lachnospiraceae bacterium]|nr:hypothetical protein [Lachnospiraceae bacterium]